MGLMKKLTSVLVASSLVLGSVGMALAAPTEEQVNASAARLAAYDIVKGRLLADGTTDLALGEPITRAELLKVVIMGLGYTEAQVNVLKGAPSFSDVDVNQWYAPYVALAKNIAEQNGFEVGYPDGTFRPNNQVTAIEALVFVMKLLGITPVTGENWIQGNIDLAVQNGVITSADAEALLDAATEPANRGLAFAIVDTAFITYAVDGKNVYQRFVDKEAPGLAVDATPESVQAATITITGTVTGASELYAGSDAITFDAEGKFSYEKTLDVGPNTITLTAKDIVGNVTTVDVVVERTVGAAANVAVEIANQIEAGSEAEMKIVVTDATGAAVEVDAESLNVTIGGNIGSYADGVFKASEKAGKGTITVTYGELEAAVVEVEIVPGPLAKVAAEVASVKPGTAVKLLAMDQFDNVIEGATFSENAANAFIEGDIFTATKAGQYEVTATIGEVSVTGIIGVYGDLDKLVIEGPATIVGNGKSVVTLIVKAVDEGGNLVADYDGLVAIDTLLTNKKGVAIKYAPGEQGETTDTYKMEDGIAKVEVTAPADLIDQEIDVKAELYKKDAVLNSDSEPTDPEVQAEGTFTITVVEQIATSIKVEAPEWLPSIEKDGELLGVPVKVTVLDQDGKAMVEGAWEFDVKITGDASLDPDDEVKSDTVDLTVDDKEFLVYALEEGDSGEATITVSYPGLTAGSDTIKVAEPLKAARIVVKPVDDTSAKVSDDAEDGIEFEVRLVDRYGVPTYEGPNGEDLFLETYTVRVDLSEFDLVDGNSDDLVFTDPALTDDYIEVVLNEGVGTFKIASKKAGSFEFKVVDPAKDVSESSVVTVDYEPGDPEFAAFKSEQIVMLRSAGKVTLTAQLYDGFGNPVNVAGKTVNFNSVGGSDPWDGVTLNGDDDDVDVTTDENGQAKVEVAIEDYRDTDDDPVEIEVKFGDSAATDPTDVDAKPLASTVSVISSATIPAKITLEIGQMSGDKFSRVSSVEAGKEIVLRAIVDDNKGRDVSGIENLLKIKASSDDVDLDDIVFETDDGDGVYYSLPITLTKAESVTFTVSVSNLAEELKAERTVSVKAGGLGGITVAEAKIDKDDPTKGEYDGTEGKFNTLTLRLTDEYGNLVSGSKVTSKVFVTFDYAESTSSDIEVYDKDGYVIDLGDPDDGIEIGRSRTSAEFKVRFDLADGEDSVDLLITATVGEDADAQTFTFTLTLK